MIRRSVILVAAVLLLSLGAAAQRPPTRPTPLRCTKEGRDPSQPWVRNVEILESFPEDNPLPRYVGAFRNKNWSYQVVLYQDAKGIFGELLSPVLDADSPTSRLYDPTLDSRSGALQFSAKFPIGQLHFSGVLRGRVIRATVTQNTRNEKMTLKRIKWIDDEDGVFYTSRAKFDCAMILFGRY